MLRYLAAIGIALCAQSAWAQYAGVQQLARVRLNGTEVWVGTVAQPGATCAMWGEYFKFDHTTTQGKSILAFLLSAKASGKAVDLWYTVSSTPGTTQENGCTTSTISVLNGVAIRD